MHTVPHLSHSDAMKIINAIRERLERDAMGAAIAVVDAHGELMAFLRTDGCPLASITIAQNKAYTAARQRESSKTVGNSSRDNNFPLTNYGELRFVGWGGGFPIVYEGQVVGGVGVSGLPEEVDMEVARMGVEAAGLKAIDSIYSPNLE